MPRIGTGLGLGLFRAAAAASGYDADAQAFFDRVTTAGGSLSTTEKNATNQLVLDMKTAGIWSSMKAIYPMVGASAAACAQNLKSSSFTGTFTSGWTFASTGVTGNGTSAYFNTTYNPNTSGVLNDEHISVYLRTNIQQTSVDMGAYDGTSETAIYARFSLDRVFCCINSGAVPPITTTTNSSAFYLTIRNSSTNENSFINSTKYTRTITSISKVNRVLYVGAQNNVGAAGAYSTRQNAFTSIGDSLTDTQASNFYTAVQAFQTTLSRQV